MQKSKDNPKLSGKNNCMRTYNQTCISFIVAKTNSHLGANCVSHGFHGLMPQTCISLEKPGCELCFPMDFMVSEAPNLHFWEKPSRTWVRIVFFHGFMGSEAPNLHLFGKNLHSHLGANCV